MNVRRATPSDFLAVAALDPANQAALNLYQRWGFTHRRFVPGYYRDNEDRYVLTRPARP